MGAPHITSFCCCMGLEVGAKCVGFLHLLASLSLMVVCSLFAAEARANVGTVDDADGLYSRSHKVAVGIAVVSVVHVLLALTLLVSVYKRLTSGLRAWVIVMSVLCCAAVLAVLVLCIMNSFGHASPGFGHTGSEIFISFIEGVIFFGVLGYCILCVYSYYLMLKSAEDMVGPNKSIY